MPLATWGKKKKSIVLAKLREKQVEINNQAEEASFVAELTNLITEIPVTRRKISRSFTLDTLSQKRFAITNRLYQSGKVSLLELQTAQAEKDNARKNYLTALKQFWERYYYLRLRVGYGF